MAKKTNPAHQRRQDNIAGQIEGVNIAADIMRANAGDDFDRAYMNRCIAEFNRRIVGLQKEQTAEPPKEWTKIPPQPCPMGQKPTACYRRDGDTLGAVIEVPLHGRLCKGCEVKVSTLDGETP